MPLGDVIPCGVVDFRTRPLCVEAHNFGGLWPSGGTKMGHANILSEEGKVAVEQLYCR